MRYNAIPALLMCTGVWAQTAELQGAYPQGHGVVPTAYGRAVDILGDLATITDSAASGIYPFVDIYRRTPGGWNRIGGVQLPPAPIGPSRAEDVVLTSDYVAIGFPGWASSVGAAYCLYLDSSTGIWGLERTLIGSPHNGVGAFGSRMAGNDTTLVVGAASTAGQFPAEGRVYVYRRIAQGWHLEATLTPPAQDVLGPVFSFGQDVALDGSRLVVSAAVGTHPLGPNFTRAGRLYVYERDPQGAWNLVARLEDPMPSHHHYLGLRVELEGDTIVAGKPRLGVEGFNQYSTGQAIVFERTQGQWRIAATLEASDRYTDLEGGDRFGMSVDIAGNLITVGAMRGMGSGAKEGAIYLFRRRADGSWPANEQERLVATPSQSRGFGVPLALDDGFVVSGAFISMGGMYSPAYFHLAGAETEMCSGATAPGAVSCHLDTYGIAAAGTTAGGIALSNCAPGSRFVILGALSGNAAGCGPVIGGGALCLCGAVTRAYFGQLSGTESIRLIELEQLFPPGLGLFLPVGTVYLQAFVGEPGGAVGFTNSAALALY